MSADRPRWWELRGDGLGWRPNQVDGEYAPGRGSTAGGVSAQRSSGKRGRRTAEAVHRARTAAGGEEAGDAACGAGDCDLGYRCGAGRGERAYSQGPVGEE